MYMYSVLIFLFLRSTLMLISFVFQDRYRHPVKPSHTQAIMRFSSALIKPFIFYNVGRTYGHKCDCFGAKFTCMLSGQMEVLLLIKDVHVYLFNFC